ncbi:MAG: asparagine synthase (glutamine-hydrolyzing), partial [Candidatus Moraniibacteriota bacterium]
MCGINGFNFKNENILHSMNEAIRHRGPDDSGTFFSDDFSLGHVRLSILDLSSLGHQPMLYEHNGKKLSIVFNGEIYNYQEIRDDLIAKGYSFRSTSDTEVILATYLEYGEDCVLQFNGMWAFCIYDHQRHSFFCSRDRFGKKPFYYYFKDGIFIFSSELKGILSHVSLNINTQENIDENAVDLYFSLGFVPAPLSIYQNVYKLEARHNLSFDLSEKKLRTWQYYEIPKYTPCYDRKKLIQEGQEILADAVKIRMRSDVPVGAFLSGGLDSSTVVGMMKGLTDVEKLHTFSIGFEGRYDETKYINIVKDYFHTKHHHEYFRESDFEGVIDSYVYAYDEPFGDFGGFPTLKVSEMAKKEVTVVLTGDGGDEVFGGYLNHTVGVKMDLIRKIPGVFRRIISKIPAKKQLNGI